jgi:formylglycine-generating enzyme required for sulfatase activity
MAINWMGLAIGFFAALPLTAQQDESVADLPGRATMAFVWIATGRFTMGSPQAEAGRQDDEGPLHKVLVSRGFWLGKYEVTQAQGDGVG